MTDKNQMNPFIDGHAIAEKAYDDRKNPFENQGNGNSMVGTKNRFNNISNGSTMKNTFINETSVPPETFSRSDNTVNKPKRKHRRDKSDLGENFVAPDGGWGWLVAIAAGLNNIFSVSLSQQMGIIFRQHFESLSISSSQITTIISTHIAVASMTGLLNGPIFRRFSYRQVALFGACLSFIGNLMAVFAGSFIVYMISIAGFYAIGRGLIASSSSLAVNTFFNLKRRTATAYQYGAAGLNPIILPYLATYLLSVYGTQGTVLIFSGIPLHCFAFSLIFHPVKWHVRKMGADAKATELIKLNESIIQKNQEAQESKETEAKAIEDEDRSNLPFYRKVIVFFDLDLLRDITYVNLLVGLTIINFVELNFTILIPFILNEFGFSNREIAIAMSCQGCCDLAFRFLVPIITRKINLSNKGVFALGVIGMCIGRAVLSITRSFAMLVPILIFLGCSKAFRIVFWSIIIPGYVPLKRLPAAAGLQQLMSGIFNIICGPLIGLIRDKSNFAVTLHFLNGLSLIALSLWLLETLYQRTVSKAQPTEGAS